MISIPNPNATQEHKADFLLSPESGTMSTITFNNPDFWRGIEVMFGIQKHETVVGINVKNGIIQAKIRFKQ